MNLLGTWTGWACSKPVLTALAALSIGLLTTSVGLSGMTSTWRFVTATSEV